MRMLALKTLPCSILILFFAQWAPLAARPKIALVLSGGGARGIAHIGVLREFEARRIPIDVITGTSIGSIIAALYASGYSLDEMDKLFQTTDWEEVLFNDRVARKDLPFRRKGDFGRYPFNFEVGFNGKDFQLPPGLVYGQKLSALLDRYFLRVADIRDFSKLPIPFKAAATDIESGKMVTLERGYLPDAIRASLAYPGLFSPVQIDGHQLLDGGATNNVPVDLAKSLGADLIVASDVSLFLKSRDQLKSVVQIMEQMITVMLQYTTLNQTEKASHVIKPDVGKTDLFTIENYSQIVEEGRLAAQPIVEKLRKFAVSEADYVEFERRRQGHVFQPDLIHEIRGDSDLVVGLRTKVGRPLDLSRLEADIKRLYAKGDYETVDYEIFKEGEKNILKIRSKSKSWGPHYLRFAAIWDGEVQGKQDGNAIINLRATELNRLNAEWETDTSVGTHLEFNSEFYQPLHRRGLFFFAPRLIMFRGDQDYYLDRDRVATAEVDLLTGGADIGIALGPVGEVRMGYRGGMLNSDVEVGVLPRPLNKTKTSALLARFRIDRLDSAYFPRQGVYGSCDFVDSRAGWGASDTYRKLGCQLHGFSSWRGWTFFAQGQAGTSLNTIIPEFDEFYLGGLRSFSGFRVEELRGQHLLAARGGILWRVPLARTLFWDRIFMGAWAETGNTFADERDIEADRLRYSGTGGLGFDTKIGAIWLAYGQSGSDHKQFYMSAGRTFGLVNFLPFYEGKL